MTKKGIKHKQIQNERRRKAVLKQRSNGLFKKLEEFSILCGAEIGLVIQNPIENETTFWPSSQVFLQRLHKFVGFSEMERTKKMVFHETLVKQRLEDEQKLVLKFENKNEEKEIDVLMNEIYVQGFKKIDDLDMHQLSLLHAHSAQLLAKLRKRSEELDRDERYKQPMLHSLCHSSPPPLAPVEGCDQRYKQPMPLSLPQPESPVGGVETLVCEKLSDDQWFVETMME